MLHVPSLDVFEGPGCQGCHIYPDACVWRLVQKPSLQKQEASQGSILARARKTKRPPGGDRGGGREAPPSHPMVRAQKAQRSLCLMAEVFAMPDLETLVGPSLQAASNGADKAEAPLQMHGAGSRPPALSLLLAINPEPLRLF